MHLLPLKDVYVYPLYDDAKAILNAGTVTRKSFSAQLPADWAEIEFGAAELGDQRRVKRLAGIFMHGLRQVFRKHVKTGLKPKLPIVF